MGALLHVVAALCASWCQAAPVSDSLEVPSSPVSMHHGHTATLPCWLNPSQSAEALEVRWFHLDHFDTPVMLYQGRKFENESQEASHVGRVSFGLKDAASGGLTAGDVSLKLENVTLEDAGDYTCYVSSDEGYDRATVQLIVTAMGTPPLLSAVWAEDNMVNLSCESEDWYPEPKLRWADRKHVLTPKSLKYSKASSGLVSVHSWLLVSSSTQVSCSVEAKEGRVQLEMLPPARGSGCSAAGWAAFALLLTVMLVSAAVLFFKKREEKAKPEEELEKLLGNEMPPTTNLSTALKYYANVTLDKEGNQYLTIRDNKLRDGQCDFPDGAKVSCVTAITGTPGFSSGQHYWEVSLGRADNSVGLKQSWWVGVTSETIKSQLPDFTPTASNGFWFLSSCADKAGSFQFSTEPKVLLPVSSRLQTLGVYLNHESGELSFYNVEDKSVIVSTTAHFRGEVFPLFNPGKGDIAPMEILQRDYRSDGLVETCNTEA